MWVLVAAMAANSVTTGAVTVVDDAGASSMIDARFDLADSSRDPSYRLRPLEAVASDDRDNPLTVTPIDDDRQRLSIGLGGSGSAKLGVAYNLILGR